MWKQGHHSSPAWLNRLKAPPQSLLKDVIGLPCSVSVLSPGGPIPLQSGPDFSARFPTDQTGLCI